MRETAVAVIAPPTLKASLVASQHAIHAPFGGVVPNCARRHMEVIVPLYQMLRDAGIHFDENPLWRHGTTWD